MALPPGGTIGYHPERAQVVSMIGEWSEIRIPFACTLSLLAQDRQVGSHDYRSAPSIAVSNASRVAGISIVPKFM
jgi:hypothetical protein